MRTAASVVAEARTALRPPPRLTLSAWADEKFYLSAESAAEPGRWSTLPYQREPMDAFTDPHVEQITFLKSARVGYTKMINAAIGYHVDHDPCAILVIQPDEDDAKGYAKEEIEPMIRDCPAVGEKFGAFTLKNSMLHKRFRGGLLQLAGARSPGNFRRVSRRVILGDEVDGYPPSAGHEGDPVALAKKRSEYFWNRKLVWGSTPTYAGASRIERLFLEGDQRRYYVPCPDCGEMQVLRFSQFSWPKGKPELAVYVCQACGSAIEHAHKRDMVHAGEWRPGPHAQFADVPAPEPFHGHASFHIWAAYSFSPNATWGQLCTEFVTANAAGPDQLKTFVNTALGETWQERGDAPEWKRLHERRATYAIGTCPPGVLFLTAGVDVQQDRLVYEVVGWGRDKQSWSIDAGVLPGDTSDMTGGSWPALKALLDRSYPHASGLHMPVTMLAIDSGFNTQVVYAWARKHPMSRVIAVKGHDAAHTVIGAPSPVDVTVGGRKLRRGYKVWPIGTKTAKSELYGWLKLESGEGVYPSGYCHFPQYDEEYFKQLTAEQLVNVKTPQGFTVLVWELIPGRQNHHLDARVYARAAAALVGMDRFQEKDWTVLERAGRGAMTKMSETATETGITPKGNAGPPSTPSPAAPAPRTIPRAGSWIPRRPHWLKKGTH
jgi:phage terminase large subunit GpA-like protein